MAQPRQTGKRLTWASIRGAKRWGREQGEWVVSEWQHSGQSVEQFARQHGVDPQRVYFWRKRAKALSKGERGTRARPEVVEVKVAGSSLPFERRVDIELGNGRRVSVAERIELEVLERIVAALER